MKGEVDQKLNWPHAHRVGVWGSGGTIPFILSLGTGRPLYPHTISPRNPLTGGWVGSGFDLEATTLP